MSSHITTNGTAIAGAPPVSSSLMGKPMVAASPTGGELGTAPHNLWSELAAVELDDEIPSPLSVDDIPSATIINGNHHDTIPPPIIDEPQTMEELQKRRALRLEQLRVEEEELMRWLKDIETSPTAALPSSVIIEHTSVASPSSTSSSSSGAHPVPLPSLPPVPTEAAIEEVIEDPYAVAVTVPATPSSPVLMPPPRAVPPRAGRPQLSITIGTPANGNSSGNDGSHTPASGLPAGAAAAGIIDGNDLGTVRRRAPPERFTFTSFDITRSQQLRDLLWSFSPISGPPSFRLLPGTTLRTTMTRGRTGSNASLGQSPACPATPPSASAAARLAAHRRRPSGRSAFGSGTWLIPPGVGIPGEELGAGSAASVAAASMLAGGVNDGVTTPNNHRSPQLVTSTGSSPQTPLPNMSPMLPRGGNGRDVTPLSLRGRRPRALPLAGTIESTSINTWHESKDEENDEEVVSRSSISSVSAASDQGNGDGDDDDDDDDSNDDTSPSSSSLSSASTSRRGSRRTGSTISSSSVVNGITSPPLSTSSNASTGTTITTWSSVSSVSSLSSRYPPPPLPPPPPLSVIHARNAAAAAAATTMSPAAPPTPPVVSYTSFGSSGSGSGADTSAAPMGRPRGNSDSVVAPAARSSDDTADHGHGGIPLDASRIALRRQAKRDRAVARLAAARHENREVDIEVRMLTTPSE